MLGLEKIMSIAVGDYKGDERTGRTYLYSLSQIEVADDLPVTASSRSFEVRAALVGGTSAVRILRAAVEKRTGFPAGQAIGGCKRKGTAPHDVHYDRAAGLEFPPDLLMSHSVYGTSS